MYIKTCFMRKKKSKKKEKPVVGHTTYCMYGTEIYQTYNMIHIDRV